MRREPGPHDFAGEAQAIEKLGFIAGHASRKHFGFPGGCGDFVALELLDDLQRTIDAVEAAAGHEVLPAQQKSLKLCGSHGFNLTSKCPEREAMDAGEDA